MSGVNELREEAIARYRELVLRVAEGEPIGPSEAGPILTAAGRSVDQLEKDADVFCQRRGLAKAVAEGEAAAARRDELSRRLEAVESRVKGLAEEFADQTANLRDEGQKLQLEIGREGDVKMAGARAAQELQRTADPGFKTEVARCHAELSKLRDRGWAITQEVAAIRALRPEFAVFGSAACQFRNRHSTPKWWPHKRIDWWLGPPQVTDEDRRAVMEYIESEEKRADAMEMEAAVELPAAIEKAKQRLAELTVCLRQPSAFALAS